MKKVALLVSCLLTLAACQRESTPIIAKTDNPDSYVEYLFKVDGCKVYRFSDNNTWVYLTTCPGNAQYHYRLGKTGTIRNQNTTTISGNANEVNIGPH